MRKILLCVTAVAFLAMSGAAVASQTKAPDGYQPPSAVQVQDTTGAQNTPAAMAERAINAFTPDYSKALSKVDKGEYLAGLLVLLASCAGLGLALTTLAVDRARNYEQGDYNDLPVIASDIIYEGAAVGDNGTNQHRPLVAGDVFKGFAEATVDNSLGAAGAKYVRTRRVGRVQLPISNFDVGDVDKLVFASDDDAFTLTQSTNSPVGRAVRFVATGTCIVAFDADNPPPGRIAELTDSSGGTASDTLAAIASTYVEATIENTVASIAAKVNALIRMTAN